jgi:hypothetical protein
MRLRVRIAVLVALAAGLAPAADLASFSVLSEDAGAWPEILSSIGIQARPASAARILVARSGSPSSPEWTARVEHGAILILEGESDLAEMFGFRPGKASARVNSLTDVHRPKLPIVWEKGLELPVFDLPEGARVFARERWTGAPLTAGLRRGAGAVVWVAAPPGEHGYERFPYLLDALRDLGMEPPFRSARTWAFFDSAYRSRVDLDYFAARWREAGIAALHVAAWHFFEPGTESDSYLKRLIEACHREGILVYAWLELPHVSEKFWDDHPEWREKTAVLQDAQLDWRKLMNLNDRDCFRAASEGVEGLLGRFDWDGVNLAELYFESLEGIDNPSRFTPMNDGIRALFRRQHGFDPMELFGRRTDAASRKLFLDFRRDLAARMEEEWLGEMEKARRRHPQLDLVLTHVDDRLDPDIRDAIGSDAARLMPLLEKQSFTFLIEDPASLWNLSSRRYRDIAEQYRPLTARQSRLAIDLNVVERYQDVYPTKQQTGTELFQIVHQAAASFARVAVYFESSLLPPDWKLLPSAAAAGRAEEVGRRTVVESASGVGLAWTGPAIVDGQPWPVFDEEAVWLPAGTHTVVAGHQRRGLHLLRVNADLKTARAESASEVRFSYESGGRALAVLDRAPVRMEVDGTAVQPLQLAGPATVILPRGQHLVTIVSQ